MDSGHLSLKAARMAAECTLVDVAAEARVSIGYVRMYEVDPNALQDARKRAKLDTIYARFPRSAAA